MAMPLSCAQRPALQRERARQTAWRAEREVTLHPRLLSFAQHCTFGPSRVRGIARRRKARTNGAATLTPLASRASVQPTREWLRRVQVDCTIGLHRHWYSVPWRFLGKTVRVQQPGDVWCGAQRRPTRGGRHTGAPRRSGASRRDERIATGRTSDGVQVARSDHDPITASG